MAAQVPSRVVGIIRVSRDGNSRIATEAMGLPLASRFAWPPSECSWEPTQTVAVADCNQLRQELVEALAELVD